MDEFLTKVEHVEFAKRMEEEHIRQNHRISNLEKANEQNNRLLISVERLATNMENMQREQKDQGERLEALEERDGEMWRKSIGYLVSAVIGGVIVFLFKQVGM